MESQAPPLPFEPFEDLTRAVLMRRNPKVYGQIMLNCSSCAKMWRMLPDWLRPGQQVRRRLDR